MHNIGNIIIIGVILVSRENRKYCIQQLSNVFYNLLLPDSQKCLVTGLPLFHCPTESLLRPIQVACCFIPECLYIIGICQSSLFCVLHFALFSARPHDSRKDQFWTPVTIKQKYNVQFEGYCCHETWLKIMNNSKRKINLIDIIGITSTRQLWQKWESVKVSPCLSRKLYRLQGNQGHAALSTCYCPSLFFLTHNLKYWPNFYENLASISKQTLTFVSKIMTLIRPSERFKAIERYILPCLRWYGMIDDVTWTR